MCAPVMITKLDSLTSFASAEFANVTTVFNNCYATVRPITHESHKRKDTQNSNDNSRYKILINKEQDISTCRNQEGNC